MRAQYIRFHNSIMGPGRGAAEIDKAYLSSAARSDERMLEIDIGETWVTLTAEKRGLDGKPYLAVRRTHVSNVRDFEEEEEKPKKRPTKGEETSQ